MPGHPIWRHTATPSFCSPGAFVDCGCRLFTCPEGRGLAFDRVTYKQ
jgi:hypothetical protein